MWMPGLKSQVERKLPREQLVTDLRLNFYDCDIAHHRRKKRLMITMKLSHNVRQNSETSSVV